MTRVNVVPVEELSNQWLIAEYRELPRVIKQDISIEGAPDRYCLGKGHVKWAKKHACWTIGRYFQICIEMRYRGFTVSHPAWRLYNEWDGEGKGYAYALSKRDIAINRQRLIEKYRLKPNYYKWTNRTKPEWLN